MITKRWLAHKVYLKLFTEDNDVCFASIITMLIYLMVYLFVTNWFQRRSFSSAQLWGCSTGKSGFPPGIRVASHRSLSPPRCDQWMRGLTWLQLISRLSPRGSLIDCSRSRSLGRAAQLNHFTWGQCFLNNGSGRWNMKTSLTKETETFYGINLLILNNEL